MTIISKITSPDILSCSHVCIVCFSSEQQSLPSNYYHRPSLDGDHPYDNVMLFQLSLEDDLMENVNLRNALVPFEQLKIMEEIGKGT